MQLNPREKNTLSPPSLFNISSLLQLAISGKDCWQRLLYRRVLAGSVIQPSFIPERKCQLSASAMFSAFIKTDY